ncbi:MAG: hypothetical protein ACI8Z5_000168 [Lentimonas sp.]
MSKRDIQPHWRPNFKIQATLPDIKVVRTDFIINFVAIAVALIAAFTLLQREYRAHVLRGSIDDMEQRIRVSEVADNLNLKKSERFRKSAQSVVELQRFFRAPVVAHELLVEFASLKPEGLIFSQVIISELISKPKGKGAATMAYTIIIVGDVEELTVLDGFKGALQNSPLLSSEGFSLLVGESMQSRDAETGITPFEISISLMSEAAAASKKGGKG